MQHQTSIVTNLILAALYCLPGIVATYRRHPRLFLVWLVDIFLGWTIIGWIAGLVWALSGPRGLSFASRNSGHLDSKWTYPDFLDKMRGRTLKMASLQSNNQQAFDFAYERIYEGGYATLNFRRNLLALDAYVQIEGPFLFDAFGYSTISVKFDGGWIKHYRCSAAADGSLNMVFIRRARNFLRHTRNSNTLTIEAEFYQGGYRQLEFSTIGLKF